MHTYTTCADCGRQLTVTPDMPHGYRHSHPRCAPDPLRSLRDLFLAAAIAGALEADQLAAQLDRQETEQAARPRRMLAAALTYATWGWPVFPCRAGHKTPATEHGLRDATTDTDVIHGWWARWPTAPVAAATGHAFDVIDIDPPGRTWLAEHDRPDGPLPDLHGRVATPRGTHLYVAPSGRGNLAGLAEGVDYRGLGGYVLLPPSRLNPNTYKEKGAAPQTDWLTYSWAVYPSPTITPGLAVAR